ncbi:MscS Small-conductance mechanosensitive channel [Burkholderiaceae bacterium]|jgi:CRP-like cAMP-binding protein/small-conductance mechanosensitive channel
MKTNNQTIFVLSRPLFWVLLALNLVVLLWIKQHTGDFFGWNPVDLNKDKLFELKSMLAITQFVLIALTLDQFLRRAIVHFNELSDDRHVPAILVQVMSVTVFVAIGLCAYVGLYDHNFTYLLASIGALSVGILYILKDVGHQVICGITLQADHIVSVDDWIELKEDGATEYLQVVELDYRMVVLKNDHGQLIRVYNHEFTEMHFINLSKQKPGVGSPRQLEIQVSARNNPDRVLRIMDLALKHVVHSNHEFLPKFSCFVSKIEEGVITYLVWYKTEIDTAPFETNGAILLCMTRFFKAAGINLNRFETQHPSENHTDTQSRLLDCYGLGILKLLSHEQIATIGQSVNVLHYYADHHVIEKGAQEDWMYIISEGCLEVKIADQHGEQKVVATLWPGDFVGEMSMLTGAPRAADVFAKADTVLVQITKEDIAPLLDSNPKLVKQFSDILAQRVAQNEVFASSDGQAARVAEESKSITTKILNFFFKKK